MTRTDTTFFDPVFIIQLKVYFKSIAFKKVFSLLKNHLKTRLHSKKQKTIYRRILARYIVFKIKFIIIKCSRLFLFPLLIPARQDMPDQYAPSGFQKTKIYTIRTPKDTGRNRGLRESGRDRSPRD